MSFISFAPYQYKTYVTHGHSNNGDGYNVCKILVRLDSSYAFKTHKVAKRKDRKRYKSFTPTITFENIKIMLNKEHDDG
jgi:hypothetical protein